MALAESDGGQARWAAGAFVAYLGVAFFVLLLGYGRWHWFAGDEWGFLAGQSLGDLGQLAAPQNEHWSTVPIVTHLLLFKLFGLNTYLPYVGFTIALHLVLAALLRVVMRRAGVGPWVATVVAGTYVLYGTGQENILHGVQANMVGSMVLGVTHLVLADHDGPLEGRDALGLCAGALAVMSSGVGVPMVAVVGMAVLLRRGVWPALVHTVPLAAMYGAWLVWAEPGSGTPELSGVVEWLRSAWAAVFVGLGHFRPVGVALAVLLVVGLTLAVRRRADFRRQAAAPVAMLAGGVLLVALAASQRYPLGDPTASRYVGIVTALSLPALGVAADAVISRWRVTAPVVLALFLIGVPGNIGAFSDPEVLWTRSFYEGQRAFVLGAARSPVARQVPRDVHPNPGEFFADQVTVGFLLDALEAGRIPDAPVLTVEQQERIDTRLIVSQSRYDAEPPPATCEVHDEPLVLRPALGQRFVFDGALQIRRRVDDGVTAPTRYSTVPQSGRTLTVQLADQTLRVEPLRGAATFTWCEPSR